MDKSALAIGRETIAIILRRFPHLQSTQNDDFPVDLSFTLPAQDGLQHEVWLALQNDDELTLGISHFQCEWFPCTDEERAEEFVDAAIGWISGDYRILEHYRGSRCVKAELQRPVRAEWKILATWSVLWLPIPFTRTFRVVRNRID